MVERFSEIRNKEVIHVCEGSRLGYVSDCCIELETGRVTAVVIPGPCRFLGLCCIRRIGEDIILVDGPVPEWRVPRKKKGLF